MSLPLPNTRFSRNLESGIRGAYCYGFNGKELDKEGMGGGASTYDYGFRIYNAALGKFLSVDPLLNGYAWNSPFCYAENDVIRSVDRDGLEKLTVTGNTITVTMRFAVFRNRPEGGNVTNEAELLSRSEENWCLYNEECLRTYGLEIVYDKNGNIEYAISGDTQYTVQFEVSIEVFENEDSPQFRDFIKKEEFSGIYLFGDCTVNGEEICISDMDSPGLTKSLSDDSISEYRNKEAVVFKDVESMSKTVEVHEGGHTLGLSHFGVNNMGSKKFKGYIDLVHGTRWCSGNEDNSDPCYDSEGMMKYGGLDISTQTMKGTQVLNIINSTNGTKSE